MRHASVTCVIVLCSNILFCNLTRAAVVSSSQVSAAASVRQTTALSSSYPSVINAGDYGMTCTNNQTVGSDGNTPDTDGLLASIAAAATLTYGVEIVLPPGVCAINREIDVPTTQAMRVTGAGIGTTVLQFFTPPGTSPPQNGLIFTPSNGASLTVDHFTISKKAGTNLGTVFLGTALAIEAAIATPNTGPVTVSDVQINPAGDGAQTDGWNISLLERNLADPVISNVSISMPGWATIPDPSGYQCSATPCAIHALPSAFNPINTPGNLAFGNAVGIAVQGVGSGNWQADTVMQGLTISGGLVGVDLQQFQGVYINDSRFVADVYGIRADSPSTLSELLAVEDTEFTDAVGGIYANGIGGNEISGSYFTPSDAAVQNLPGWTGIWIRNGNNTTVSSNNVVGGGASAEPEYGIYLSSDVANGFPAAITGNTVYGLTTTGSVCMGNNQLQGSINASGNSLFSCATYVSDTNGGNAYADNVLQYPDMYGDGSRDLDFAKAVTIGTAYDPGSLKIDDAGRTTLSVDSAGDISNQGMIISQGAITSGSTISGSSLLTGSLLTFVGNQAHSAAQELVGNFYFPYGGGPRSIALNPPSGALPPVSAGIATLSGELTCNGSNGDIISWHVVGHYVASSGSPTLRSFLATAEGDADSQKFLNDHQLDSTVTPAANPAALGLMINFGTNINEVINCSSLLTEMVED